MNKFCLIALLFALALGKVYANTNYWEIIIGQESVYFTQEFNGRDTVPVSRSLFNEKDTLFATYYQCGGMASGFVTQLRVISSDDATLLGPQNEHNGISYRAQIPVKTLMDWYAFTGATHLSISIRYTKIENKADKFWRSSRIAILELV